MKEAIGLSLANFLRAEGYDIGDLSLVLYKAPSIPSYSHFSIMAHFEQPKPKHFWSNIGKIKPRREVYGIIGDFTQMPDCMSEKTNNWKLEVFGRDSIPKMEELAEKMRKHFGVSVGVMLTDEDSRIERTYHEASY